MLVSAVYPIADTSGGVGICTQEYLRTLEAAGFRLTLVTFEWDTRFLVRVRRKLRRFLGYTCGHLLP